MLIFYSIILLLILINLLAELKRDLMMFQQNSYRIPRYKKWLKVSGDSTSYWRLTFCILFFVLLFSFRLNAVMLPVTALLAGSHAGILASKHYKLPLAWTKRAKRIYTATILISAFICCATSFLFPTGTLLGLIEVVSIALVGCYCASHIIIMCADIVLIPVEKSIYRKYYNEAASIISSMPDLKIIGITGSYGKTSTKHFLCRILSEQFDTLMTPGNFNTDLGVVRTIREYLKPYNEVFIVEMGAKEVGDIKVICDLVHPKYGIISSVGPQHLDTFKTVENIQSTKFELIDSLPADGLGILNNDFELICSRPVDNVAVIRYSSNSNSNGSSFHATDIEYSPQGTDFTVVGNDGQSWRFHTRLVGECNISNLVAAIAMALHLGMDIDKIRYAVSEIQQVEHRLQMKRTPSGVNVIDDAYNSNPVGSAMALDVLKAMQVGKRIIVTPGMVELGDRTYDLNFEFGKKIAHSADIAVVVCRFNREAIVAGIESESVDTLSVHTVDTFAEAQRLLGGILQPGDTVLYENDLPDTYK